MVILFSNRKNTLEKEIIEILTAFGGNFISDKVVASQGGYFTVTACYKKTELNIKNGIALIIDDTEKFKSINLPNDMIGICEDQNQTALSIFKTNGLPVITCGNNPKNTLTISSIDFNNYIITLQREIIGINGKIIYPADYKISLKKPYSPQAVMLSCCVLCLVGGF